MLEDKVELDPDLPLTLPLVRVRVIRAGKLDKALLLLDRLDLDPSRNRLRGGKSISARVGLGISILIIVVIVWRGLNRFKVSLRSLRQDLHLATSGAPNLRLSDAYWTLNETCERNNGLGRSCTILNQSTDTRCLK
jgi:hypothetical protein